MKREILSLGNDTLPLVGNLGDILIRKGGEPNGLHGKGIRYDGTV